MGLSHQLPRIGHGNMQYYSTFSFILTQERTWKQIILNFRKVILGSDNYFDNDQFSLWSLGHLMITLPQ